MSQAQGSRVQLAIIPEVTYGVTPSTPQTQLIEFEKFDANYKTATLKDDSIRNDRQTSYARAGNKSAEGSLDVVLAPDNFDTLLEAALMGTWSSTGAATVGVGVVDRSFSFEQGFTDIAQYRVFTGMKVNTLKMDVTTDKLVTMSLGLFGSTTTAFSGTSIDSTPTAIPVRDKFYHEGGSFTEGGATIAYLSDISFELNNNVTGNYALGSTGYRNVTTGRVEVTGKCTALFESVALYNKFVSNADSTLGFSLVAGAKTLAFAFPRVKYVSGDIKMSGFAGVMVELNWMALYDSTANTTMTITRSA